MTLERDRVPSIRSTLLTDRMINSSFVRSIPALRGLLNRPVTEKSTPANAEHSQPRFPGSLQLRHVDVGSCNGCEIEITSAFGPVYDVSHAGVRLVASPRHADGLLITGVVTNNMALPLQKTFEAMPSPAVVVACGDCAINGGVFGGAYGIAGDLDSFVPIDVTIPGCPPNPAAITETLRGLTGR